MHKIFQEPMVVTPKENINIAIFLLITLLKENNGILKIRSMPTESLLEYGIAFDNNELRPNKPLILKLCKVE
jgi:hypothetical protein